ncbi:MAG: c-type cytochrome biogenesis protein CcsB [Desulfobacteraceae bacterium]
MHYNTLILSVVTFIYGLAAVLYLFSWVFHKEAPGKLATWVTLLACIGNAAGIALRWYESYQLGGGYGHAPLSNIYESLTFFSLTIGVLYLGIERRYGNRVIGVFALPLAFFALAYASFGTNDQIQPLIPALKSNWLIAHVISCFIGYAAFAVGSGAGLLYLLKDKGTFNISTLGRRLLWVLSILIWVLAAGALLFIVYALFFHFQTKMSGLPGLSMVLAGLKPLAGLYIKIYRWVGLPLGAAFPNVFATFLVVCGVICALFYLDADSAVFKLLPELNIVDELTHQLIMFGFLLLTVGIITGSVWANSAWGRYWGWDPKETWSFITWLIYAALLHFRMMRGWRGKRIAVLSIVGFAAVLFTYFGVNLLPGLHSYGAMKG